MKQEMTASQKEAFYNQEVREKYFNAVKCAMKWEEYDALCDFKRKYPEQFSFFQKVHRLRSEINKDLQVMKMVSSEIYFGTLTFNAAKNKNKEACKRKEAFEKLKRIFKYVLLVEEYGGVNGRFHIHFLAAFKNDHNFHDFTKMWHSRQNIKEVNDDNVGKYLVSYVVKDLPRLHRNRELCWLRKKYTKYKHEVFMNEAHSTPESLVHDRLHDIFDLDEWIDTLYVKPVV